MPTGVPHVLKCPKCKRGKYGYVQTASGLERYNPVEKGIERTNEVRHRWCGRFKRWQRFVRCRDCGHTWWTTLDSRSLDPYYGGSRKDS